jgi:hypothetical protein
MEGIVRIFTVLLLCCAGRVADAQERDFSKIEVKPIRMLVETTKVVRARLDAGKTLGASQAEGLAEEWCSFGTGFVPTDQWIETIYTSLSQKSARKKR